LVIAMTIKTWTSRDGVVKARKVVVEDHGNGFMVVGTNIPDEARKALKDYVDDPTAYAFATPNHYDGRSAVWLATAPGQHWDGQVDCLGRPEPR
jgi:hypothetical protein